MPFRSTDYDDPRWDEFVGLCDRCGRPVREDEWVQSADGRKACWNGVEGCATDHEVAVDEDKRAEAASRGLRAVCHMLEGER